MDGSHRDSSPWQSRSPSIGLGGRASPKLGPTGHERDVLQADEEYAEPSQPTGHEHNSAAAVAEHTNPQGSHDDVQFIRSEPTTMNPPPRPGPRAASIASDDARDFRNESPMFCEDSRQSTREPTTGPQLPPRPSPLMAPRSLRSESPLFVESRHQTLEPQSHGHTHPSFHTAALPFVGRNAVPSPTPDPRNEDSLFVQSRETTAEPQSASISDLSPQLQTQPAPLPVAEPAPTPDPMPPAEPETISAVLDHHPEDPEVNTTAETTNNEAQEEERLQSHPEDDLTGNGAALESASVEAPPTHDAPEAADGGRAKKKQKVADDRLENFIEKCALNSSKPRRAANKKKTAGTRSRNRKRGPARATTPASQPEEVEAEPEAEVDTGERVGEGDARGEDSGGQGDPSTPSDEDFLNHQSWMQRAQRTNLGLRSKKDAKGGKRHRDGSRSNHTDRSIRAGRSSGSNPNPKPWRSHGIVVNPNRRNLEMPTRGDFIYGYGRLVAKRFEWVPKEEEKSTGRRLANIAPKPCIGDPKDDEEMRRSRLDTPVPWALSTSRVPHKTPAADTLEKAPPSSLLLFPSEVRENIWRQLLLAKKAILVHERWTRVCRVRRPRNGGGRDPTRLDLYPAILSTCKLFGREGSGILYGENTFRYRMRDLLPAKIPDVGKKAHDDSGHEDPGHDQVLGEAEKDENDGDADYVDDGEQAVSKCHSDKDNQGEKLINIERHFHLFRHIAVEIEQNRTSPDVINSVAEAVKVFSDRVQPPSAQNRSTQQANIHTLKVIIHPTINDDQTAFTFINFFNPESPVVTAMRSLKSQYIHIDIMSGWINRNEKNRRLVIDQRPQRAFMRLDGGRDKVSLVDKAMILTLNKAINWSSKVMGELNKHVEACCEHYAANYIPLHSPYCWFVSDIDEDENEYEDMF